ncbi:UDP-glycosyltransferase UGT5-like [Phymastichus coffea]|uniref:UDP-glycosyltransferase UGT5-like n=1 Tax=Phymastichus coffea TaxID=108790 RepID=UPI00273C9D80|nr:UDP-glycosyltransferase UGT5-like [Phymastichus coffea]
MVMQAFEIALSSASTKLLHLLSVAIVILSVSTADANKKYNILAMIPCNGKRHFYVAEVLFEELAQRGHNVTLLGHYPKKKPIPNYHDISMENEIADGVYQNDMKDIYARETNINKWPVINVTNCKLLVTTLKFCIKFFSVGYYKGLYTLYDKRGERVVRQHFGLDIPSLRDAGTLARKPKALPEDLEDWARGARHGLIYLSLGSMINSSSVAADEKRTFFEAFAQLPQRVLMKWDAETMAGLPENVRLTRWAPQNDVPHHPNVRLFITYGGMLSSVEAVHAGVPTVIIPFFGDQLTNGLLLHDRSLGIVLNYRHKTRNSISNALRAILFDPRSIERLFI